jgi:phosphoribosyl-AMP cyclohydrolase / phosphoribosyl-ATP pyrophosphohydrolase
MTKPAKPGKTPPTNYSVLTELEQTIRERRTQPTPESYTSKLFAQGTDRIAQKVGEEATEVVIAAVGKKTNLAEEAADLIYHLLVLLEDSATNISEVLGILKRRDLQNPRRKVQLQP